MSNNIAMRLGRAFARKLCYDDSCRNVPSSESFFVGGNSQYFGDSDEPLCNDSRATHNASHIYEFFRSKGWSLQAISALLGNIQQESTFNPALIEIGGTGHGFVQWTPPEDLYSVLDALYGHHNDWHDPAKQLEVIWAEYQESTGLAHRGIEPQWYKTSKYKVSWEEWAHSVASPEYLAQVFQACYERPYKMHSERSDYAREWYEYLRGWSGDL